MKTWTWTPEGLKVGDTLYTLRRFNPVEFMEVVQAFDLSSDVYGTLRAGKLAIAGGRADYEDAYQNALNLCLGIRDAEARAIADASRIAAFFEPDSLTAELTGEDLIRFALDAVGRINGPPARRRARPKKEPAP